MLKSHEHWRDVVVEILRDLFLSDKFLKFHFINFETKIFSKKSHENSLIEWKIY